MKINRWGWLILAIIVIFFLSKTRKEGNPDDKYSSEWQSPSGDEIALISPILVKERISGCGEYRLKQATGSDSEYLLACTSDGDNWNFYVVWTSSKEVMGPLSDKFTPPN